MTINLDGRSFEVTRGGGTVYEVKLGGKCAGFFAFDERGRVTVRGWYANVARSDDEIHAVGLEVANLSSMAPRA